MIQLKEIHVKGLTVVINNQEVYLSIDEVKELQQILNSMVKQDDGPWLPSDVTYPDSFIDVDEDGMTSTEMSYCLFSDGDSYYDKD